MLDILASIRAYLADQPGLTAHTGNAGQRIYAGPNLPPEYSPADGAGILLNIRGGGQDYTSLVLSPSVQFRTYGPTMKAALAADRALYDVLNDAACWPIKEARLETPGQPLTERDTLWPFVLSFYQLYLSNS